MKNTFVRIFILITIFLIVLPLSISLADIDGEGGGSAGTTDALKEDLMNPQRLEELNVEDLQTKSTFEKVVTGFFLSIGDYAQDYLSQIFKEEITIDKIVYNDVVLLNANFFENSTNSAASNASTIVKEAINRWYKVFKSIALVVIMISIVGAGIRILLGTAGGMAKASESIKKVVMAFMLIFFFPYVMRYAFEINEAIVTKIRSQNSQSNGAIGASISQVSDLMLDDLEERSPQYVSLAGLRVSAGSSEATQLYLNRIERYGETGDVMRIMRAFAGVTLRFMYVIIWYIMLVQLYALTILYIKRYVVIAFLIAVYPLVVIGYVTGGMFAQAGTAFNHWCSKFFSNVFLQTLHAIIYGVISGIIMSQVRDAMIESKNNSINWILMIIATSFLFSAEKILSRFWNAAIDADKKKGLDNILNAPKKFINNFKGK